MLCKFIQDFGRPGNLVKITVPAAVMIRVIHKVSLMLRDPLIYHTTHTSIVMQEIPDSTMGSPGWCEGMKQSISHTTEQQLQRFPLSLGLQSSASAGAFPAGG